jgi:hypothetical protein
MKPTMEDYFLFGLMLILLGLAIVVGSLLARSWQTRYREDGCLESS